MAASQAKQRPAARKQRRTTVSTQWFFDTYASGDEPRWRFHPTDTAHRAVRPPQIDEDGNPLGMEQRPWEVKGWVPAAQALSQMSAARKALKDAPEPVKKLAKTVEGLGGDEAA